MLPSKCCPVARDLLTLSAVLLAHCALTAQQQTTAGSPATYSGCVSKVSGAPDTLVLNTPTACVVLKGRLSADQIAGHTIELEGILQPATGSAPATIQVDTVRSVGHACSDTCALRPASRGLKRPPGVVPGSEGGTPGVTASSPHQ